MSFFGSELSFSPVETTLPGVTSPQTLYASLLDCWCAETCAPRMRERWSPENPTLGQCSITAFLAQDLFGGIVWGIPLPDGGFHCFNEACGGVFDLTSEQFGGGILDYADASIQHREDHFAKREKYERYLLLKQRLLERMK
ncbi:MAG: hypothetical protein J5789_08770 [Oscillospiraceae bacterium]|nr:hypothetical protein [Oscillospiraceae bacterium]